MARVRRAQQLIERPGRIARATHAPADRFVRMALTVDGHRFPEPTLELHAPDVRAATGRSAEQPSPFERVARGLASAIDHGEHLVGRAAAGGYEQMDAATLIAVQAGIYRYGEAVDLASKLVDRIASATKTVLESAR